MKFNIEFDPQNPQDITDAIEVLMRLEVPTGEEEKEDNVLPGVFPITGAKEPLHMSPTPDNNTNGEELDPDGRPWDSRIDTEKKTKTRDGRWKLKRGADKKLVAEIIASYKNKSGVTTQSYEDPDIPQGEPDANEIFGGPQPPTVQLDFPAFVTKLNSRLENPVFNQSYAAVIAQFDGAMLTDLAGDKKHLLPLVDEALDNLWNNIQG